MREQIVTRARVHRPWEVLRFVRHLPDFIRLFFGLLGDRRVGLFARALLVAAAVYVVSPMDFLPDLIPALGQVDDLALFAMACRVFIRLCPRAVVDEHVARVDRTGRWLPFS